MDMKPQEIQLRPSEETTLSSRGYRLLKKLGEGSYATVYLTEFKSTVDEKAKQLACKIVDTNKAPRDFIKKFLPRELEILVKLNHPHIIHVHSIFQRKMKYFIFMRHAELGDLLEFILKRGPISEAQSRVWMRQLALALQYLHEIEIAHRDLKCENCLLTSNYNLKVADLGFARYVIDASGRKVTSTTYCGSLSYAAPEILRGAPYHPKISDLWSTGVILYIMLDKAMPFDDTNIRRLHDQQLHKKWKFRAKVVDNLSEEVKNVVSHLLEPDIGKRWKAIDIVRSAWVAQDPRLTSMSSAEEQSLAQAQIDRKCLIEHLRKKADHIDSRRGTEEVKILKEALGETIKRSIAIENTELVLEQKIE